MRTAAWNSTLTATVAGLVVLAPATVIAGGDWCWSNEDCLATDYCFFDVCAAETGVCLARPAGCPDVWEPVCGCDGLTYSNSCHAAMAGMSADVPGICGGCPADLTADAWIDATDLALLLGAWGAGDHPADFNEDGKIDAADLAQLLGSWGPCLEPDLHGCTYDGCLEAAEPADGFCEEDTFELIVQGNSLTVAHLSASYNCCLDEITVTLNVEGNLLSFLEEEWLSTPCFCVCCYNVSASVVDLAPGTYTVEYCWYDYESGDTQCHVQDVVISG